MTAWMRWSGVLICALLAAGGLRAQSSAFSQGNVGSPTSNIAREQLAKVLKESLPPHATMQDAPAFYRPDNLYQYIDGGADIFLLYDFRLLVHQDFRNGDLELTADIYDMGTPEDAFGMYASERSTGYDFVPIGVEGYRSKGILNFLQDQYYVKLAGLGPGADPLLDQLARALSERIGGSRGLPALLWKLPQENRVKHSEQYMRKDPMGHAFLAPAYIVAYAWGPHETKLVISVADDAAGAKARLQQLTKHFKESGECVNAADLGEDGIRASNSFEGRVFARTQGRYVIALLNPPDNGTEILAKTAQSLP